MSHPMHHNIPHAHLVCTVQECEATCEHMIAMLLKRQDLNMRKRQLLLLNDCIDICTLLPKYLARNSAFSKSTADLCAVICETCGKECAKHPDPESQNCAQTCMNCARECRIFAMS